MNHDCLQRPDGVLRSPRGRALSGIHSFQNRDARIHVDCTGCITRPFHSCDMLQRLQEVHVQLRLARVQHTGDLYAGSTDTLRLLDTVPDELPKPQVHRHFADWAESQGQAGR